MKSRFFPIAGCLLLGCTLFPSGAAAAETAQEPSPGGPTPSPVAKAKLPYGADDVVRLSTARVNEEIILNYIQTSGTIYNLTPPDIVRLRDQGVSDRVINAMIDQRRVVPLQAAADRNLAQSQAAATPAPVVANTVYVAQTPAVIVQPQPEPPKSTLHIIPYPAARAAYYGPPPHYYRPPDHGWYYRPLYPRFSAHLGWRGPGCW